MNISLVVLFFSECLRKECDNVSKVQGEFVPH